MFSVLGLILLIFALTRKKEIHLRIFSFLGVSLFLVNFILLNDIVLIISNVIFMLIILMYKPPD